MKISKLKLFNLIFILAFLTVGCFYITSAKPAQAATTNSPSDIFGITVTKAIDSCASNNNTLTVKFTFSIDKTKLYNQSIDSISSASYYGTNLPNIPLTKTSFSLSADGQHFIYQTSLVLNKNQYYQPNAQLYARRSSGSYVTQTQTNDYIIFYGCYANINDLNLTIEPTLVNAGSGFADYSFKLKINNANKLEHNEYIYVQFTDGKGGTGAYALTSSNAYTQIFPATKYTSSSNFALSATITSIYGYFNGSYTIYPANVLNPNFITQNLAVALPANLFNLSLDSQVDSCSASSGQIDVKFKISVDKSQLYNGDKNSIQTNSYLYLGQSGTVTYLTPDKFSLSADGTKYEANIISSLNKSYSYTPSVVINANNVLGYTVNNSKTLNSIIYGRCFQDIGLNITPKSLVNYYKTDSGYPYYYPYYYVDRDFTLQIDPAKLESGENIYVYVRFEDGAPLLGYWLNSSNYTLTIPSAYYDDIYHNYHPPYYPYYSPTRGEQTRNIAISASVYKYQPGVGYYLVSPQPTDNLSQALPLKINFKGKPNVSNFSAESVCDSGKNTFKNHFVWKAQEATRFLISRKEEGQPDENYTLIKTIDLNATQLTKLKDLVNYNNDGLYDDTDQALENGKKYVYKIVGQDEVGKGGNPAFDYPVTLQAITASCAPTVGIGDITNITEQININVAENFDNNSKDGIKLKLYYYSNRYEKLAIRRKTSLTEYREIIVYNKDRSPTCDLIGYWNNKYYCRNDLYSYSDFGTDDNPLISGTTYTYQFGASYFDNSGTEKWVWSDERSVQMVGQAPVINDFYVTSGCWTGDTVLFPGIDIASDKYLLYGNQLNFTWDVENADRIYVWGRKEGSTAYSQINYSTYLPLPVGVSGITRVAIGTPGSDWALGLESFYIVAYRGYPINAAKTSSIYTLNSTTDKKTNCLSPAPIQFSVSPKCSNTEPITSQVEITYDISNRDPGHFESATGLIVTRSPALNSPYNYSDILSSTKTESMDNSEANKIFYFAPSVVNKNGIIGFSSLQQGMMARDCGGGTSVDESNISGNVFSGNNEKNTFGISTNSNPNIIISPDSVFSTSNGSITVGNSAQQLSGYNPLNIAKWTLAQKKAEQAIKKLKNEQATQLLGISDNFCLYTGLSGTCVSDDSDSKKYPNGRLWYIDNSLTLNGETNFYGKGTIIVMNGNVEINGNVNTGSSSSLGIIANNGNININSDKVDNHITNIQGFYYANGEINIK
jgi:hypothetical protein